MKLQVVAEGEKDEVFAQVEKIFDEAIGEE